MLAVARGDLPGRWGGSVLKGGVVARAEPTGVGDIVEPCLDLYPFPQCV